ncbi:hypothetical protein LINGRAHAP2_LOCUS29127 [Linum grandiflorum]
MRQLLKAWSKTVTVMVLNANISFLAIKKQLEHLWATEGAILVSDMSNRLFAVRFESKNDYLGAAYGGSCIIFNYYLAVLFWTLDFDVHQPLKRLLTWILLLKLQSHYFNDMVITRIVGYVG